MLKNNIGLKSHHVWLAAILAQIIVGMKFLTQ